MFNPDLAPTFCFCTKIQGLVLASSAKMGSWGGTSVPKQVSVSVPTSTAGGGGGSDRQKPIQHFILISKAQLLRDKVKNWRI